MEVRGRRDTSWHIILVSLCESLVLVRLFFCQKVSVRLIHTLEPDVLNMSLNPILLCYLIKHALVRIRENEKPPVILVENKRLILKPRNARQQPIFHLKKCSAVKSQYYSKFTLRK